MDYVEFKEAEIQRLQKENQLLKEEIEALKRDIEHNNEKVEKLESRLSLDSFRNIN